jgi:TonB family protein
MRRLLSSVGLLLFLISLACAQKDPQPTRIGVLDFGSSTIGKQSADKLRASLRVIPDIQLLDADLSTAAARGVGYTGSLNMSLTEARDLGAAMDSEFYFIGDAQTLRRSSSKTPVYYESYAAIFVISSRTGRLIFWDRLNAESDNPRSAEEELSKSLSDRQATQRCIAAIQKAQVEERSQRAVIPDSKAPLIEEAPEDDKMTAEEDLRLPKPYRRLRPAYPESAARAAVEATVDVVVDVGVDGEVGKIQVERWAGFGLDETTVATVRQLHFFPAMRNGTPIPMRVLLRYNFRKPSQ